jgi:hypothetical protein
LLIRLLTSTPRMEALIATAMLTTTGNAVPSTLFYNLSTNPERVSRIVERLEVQHGSILEHNRLIWLIEAEDSEVMEVLLSNRFFNFTKLSLKKWLMSANLRAVLEYKSRGGEFAYLLFESLKDVASTVYVSGRR